MRTIVLTALVLMAAGSVTAQTKPTADPNKQICKSHIETGSLAKRIRECHSAAEWQQMAENGRKQADDYQQVMSSSRGGT